MKKFFAASILIGFFLTLIAAMESPPTWKEREHLPINLLSYNPGFERGSVSGWYACNASGAAPTTDMTPAGGGAIGGISFELNKTTPIFGTADLKISKDSGDYQGDCVFTEFTLPKGFEYTPLSIKFWTRGVDYQDGDVKVFIANKMTSQVTQLADNEVTGSGEQRYVWDSANATTYQLILWNTATTSSAWDLHIDQASIGPKEGTWFPAISDMEPVTVTGSWTTNTTYVAKAAREGQFAFFHVIIKTTGSPTNTVLTIDLPWNIDLEAFGSADTSENRVTPLSRGTIRDAGVSSYDAGVYHIDSFPANRLQIASYSNASNNTALNAVSASSPFTFGNGDGVEVWFKVPIKGWTSGNKTIGDIDVNVPVFFQGKSLSSQSLTTDVTDVVVDSIIDDLNIWDGSKATIPSTDIYEVSILSRAASGSASFLLWINGVSSGVRVGYADTSGWTSGSALFRLNRNDVISIRSNSNFSIEANSQISIKKISGGDIFRSIDRSNRFAGWYSGNGGQPGSNCSSASCVVTELDADTTVTVTRSAQGQYRVNVPSGYCKSVLKCNVTAVHQGAFSGSMIGAMNSTTTYYEFITRHNNAAHADSAGSFQCSCRRF